MAFGDPNRKTTVPAQRSSGAKEPIHNLVKDPDDWKTGEDPATEAQLSFAQTIAEGLGDGNRPDFSSMNKAEISEWIDTHK